MPELEKVIKGLELCVSNNESKCFKCPYSPQCAEYYYTALKEDALALLKEQNNCVHELQKQLDLSFEANKALLEHLKRA